MKQAISVSQTDNYPVYFKASKTFLGDQKYIYNQYITFSLCVTQKFAAWSNR